MESLKKECSICGKIIYSLYPEQLKNNFEIHMAKHGRENKKEEEKEKEMEE